MITILTYLTAFQRKNFSPVSAKRFVRVRIGARNCGRLIPWKVSTVKKPCNPFEIWFSSDNMVC